MIGMVAFPLSDFIRDVEDGAYDSLFSGEASFAKKPLFHGKTDVMSEFIWITFLVMKRRFDLIRHDNTKRYIGFVIANTILTGILFWSNGWNVISVLFGISTVALLSLSVVDWKTQYIPLEMNGVIFFCGLIRLFADESDWLDHVIGLFAVSGFLFLINRVATPILKKRYAETDVELERAIGDGDIKLMAATGFLLGWKLNFLALMIGCIMGSIIHTVLMLVKKGERQFALGPYLSLGVYITMISGSQLISWYLNILGVKPL